MTSNPHLIDAETLRKLSGKRSSSAVRKWANRQGIKTLEGAEGPWTTTEAVNKALGVGGAPELPRAPVQPDRCIDHFIYPRETILQRAIPHGQRLLHDGLHDPSGIYFLVDAGEIAYVGLSIHISRRINEHFCEGMRFSHVWMIEVPRALLSDVEAFYIHAIRPAWNVKYPPLCAEARRLVASYGAMS